MNLPVWWPAIPAVIGWVLIIDWRDVRNVVIEWWREPKF
jgi:hypothetical protein